MRVVNVQFVEDKSGKLTAKKATETNGFASLPGEVTNKRNFLRSLKNKFESNLVKGLR